MNLLFVLFSRYIPCTIFLLGTSPMTRSQTILDKWKLWPAKWKNSSPGDSEYLNHLSWPSFKLLMRYFTLTNQICSHSKRHALLKIQCMQRITQRHVAKNVLRAKPFFSYGIAFLACTQGARAAPLFPLIAFYRLVEHIVCFFKGVFEAAVPAERSLCDWGLWMQGAGNKF